MSYMFNNCSSLINLNMTDFLTDNVTNMSHLLYNCEKLNFIDFSSFNTTKVNDYNNIFDGLSENGTFVYNRTIFTISGQIPETWAKTDINNN